MKKTKVRTFECPHCNGQIDDVLIFSRFGQTATLRLGPKGRPFYDDVRNTDHLETLDINCPSCMGDLKPIIGEGDEMDDATWPLDKKHTYLRYNVDGSVDSVEIDGLIDVNKAAEVLKVNAKTVSTHWDSECGATWFFVNDEKLEKNKTYPWFYGVVIEGQGAEPFVVGVDPRDVAERV